MNTRYTVEERVFIVRTYWKTASIKECQRQFLKQFGGRKPPAKSSIQHLAKKLETTGTLLDVHEGGRPKLPEATVQEVKNRLQASPQKSLRQLSQELGVSPSTCQRAAKRANLRAWRKDSGISFNNDGRRDTSLTRNVTEPEHQEALQSSGDEDVNSSYNEDPEDV